MFNPDNYGEEEFGPDDPKAKVKKTRKKKKVTKAIVVFGGADEAAEAKKSVKASHNLKVGRKKSFTAALHVTFRHLERLGKKHGRGLYTKHQLPLIQPLCRQLPVNQRQDQSKQHSYPSLSQQTG